MACTHTSSSNAQPDPGSVAKPNFFLGLVQLAEGTPLHFCPKLLRGQGSAEFPGSQTMSHLVCI